MDDATIGWVGGIGGSLIGLAGGVYGTRAALRHARSAEERRRIGVLAAVVVVLVVGLLAAQFLLPSPYHWAVWPVYLVALLAAILWGNRWAGTGPGTANGV